MLANDKTASVLTCMQTQLCTVTSRFFTAAGTVVALGSGVTLAMTLGNSHLAAVLYERPGRIASPNPPALDVLLAVGVISGVRALLAATFRTRASYP